jgi:catechol 2,3-dioxygenase-like lactoylglutathione lyase family enzyme
MIKGVHAMFYSPRADALRAFLRDQLGLPFVDTGGGWLIFSLPEAEVASHPAPEARQQLSFYCDDLPATVAELQQRGVEFTAGVTEAQWGWLTRFRLPDGGEAELYQPKYSTEGAQPA